MPITKVSFGGILWFLYSFEFNLCLQCPTTIVPFFGDQFFWGDRIYEKGLGPAPIPIAQLNVENLSNSIGFMLQPEVNKLDFSSFIYIPCADRMLRVKYHK